MNGSNDKSRLGIVGLTALVFGMVVGSGIFNIPQNMAAGAGLGAVAIAWLITAAGMLLLVTTFKLLADRRPDLNEGIYLYAEKGFGRLTGFIVAWGYWLCACFANVAYAVMLNDSLGAFFPCLLSHGWPTVAVCSVFIWIMYLIISSGMRTSKIIAVIAAAVKLGVIAMIVLLLGLNVRYDLFQADVWCLSDGIGGIGAQVRSTMLVTLWCFIGIEGAVVMSGRAKRITDVGKAGIIGFAAAWLLYVLVSVFCYGIMSRARLAGLCDPSAAYALKYVCGDWAYWLVIAAVILSITGGWFAWTVVTAEVPYSAARHGIFPRFLGRENSHGAPERGLLASSIVMQSFLLLVAFAENAYLMALNITGMMILPAYLFSGMYLVKLALADVDHDRGITLSIGIGCTLYCFWMIYAAGIGMLAQALCFYAAGLPFYRRR